MGVITMPFSVLVVQCYSWIRKTTHGVSLGWSMHGWMKVHVTKKCHSQACLVQRWWARPDKDFVGCCPQKLQNLITLGNLYPYGITQHRITQSLHRYHPC